MDSPRGLGAADLGQRHQKGFELPELPEVERARRLLTEVCAGRRIERAICARDEIVYDGVSPATFRRRLMGRTVLEVGRWGKVLWLELDRRPWPVIHLGMTGGFETPGRPTLALASAARGTPDSRWPPRFRKLHLFLEGGREVVFTNKRRLGRLRLREDPWNEPPICRLGFDPLLDLPSPHAFQERIRRRSATLKGILLDQTFAAGVGNWIADEVLYQAGLDPRRRGNSLDSAEARRLRGALKRVVETAVRADADKSRFPRTWLFHRRWGKNADATTARGERIRHIQLAGRTTAWVPSAQS